MSYSVKDKDKLLSKKDIDKILGHPIPGIDGSASSPCKFVLYDDLPSIRNYEELFGGYNNVLLLYRTSETIGHWVGLKNFKNDILFFDSFGMSIDDQLEHTPINYRAELSRILLNCPKTIHYNDTKFQDDNSTVCGRYVALFFKYCTNIELFIEILETASKYIEADDLVCLLTQDF